MTPGNRRSQTLEGDERLIRDGNLRCLLGIPKEVSDGTRIAVAVHGVSRNAREHFAAFAPLADQANWMLVVPLFDEDSFPDYQRLGRPGKGGRADLSLIGALSLLCARLGLPERPICLFGHSGGAQFAHRFAMAHPGRVARYAISAPGWYTFPDDALDYPYGLAQVPASFGTLRPADFLRIPGAVFVGGGDCRDGRTLRRNAVVDSHQGDHRQERAMRWTRAMNGKARAMGLAEPLRLEQVHDAAHSFSGLVRRGRLHERVWEFLTASEETAA